MYIYSGSVLQTAVLYFLLHYITLNTLVTFKMKNLHKRKYDKLLKYNMSLKFN